MFLFTVTRPGLRRAGALVLCAACLVGTAVAASHYMDRTVTAGAEAQAGIETTQDIARFFTGYGFEVDLANTAVDKVKIPRQWDDSFAAFDQVVQESGMSLREYKGKTVEKWLALCPARSTGETDCYCVLLVYKTKPVGAYLLEKPTGEVSGLVSAAKTMAEQAQADAEAAAQQPGEAQETTAESPENTAQVSADVGEQSWPTE